MYIVQTNWEYKQNKWDERKWKHAVVDLESFIDVRYNQEINFPIKK